MKHHAPRRLWCRALGAGVLGPLSGCTGLIRPTPPLQFFTLHDFNRADAPQPERDARTLLIASAPTAMLYASPRMVFTRDGQTLAYYYAAQWSERPARYMLNLAEHRLSRHSGLRTVALSTSGIQADLLLTLRLDAFVYHDTHPAGAFQLQTRAELLDWPTHQLRARRDFALSAPVLERHPRGVAQAASVALTAWLDALTLWLNTALPPLASARAPFESLVR